MDHFDDFITKAIERSKHTGIKPLKFEATLQYKNRELYELLSKLTVPNFCRMEYLYNRYN
jgi:hypothetical protein